MDFGSQAGDQGMVSLIVIRDWDTACGVLHAGYDDLTDLAQSHNNLDKIIGALFSVVFGRICNVDVNTITNEGRRQSCPGSEIHEVSILENTE